MGEGSPIRWAVGIIGGLLVCAVVTVFTAALADEILTSFRPEMRVAGFIVSLLLGLLGGFDSFRRSVWPKQPKRPPHGFCRDCGYDLTGNTSGVCPECGAIVPVNSVDSATSCSDQEEQTEGTKRA